MPAAPDHLRAARSPRMLGLLLLLLVVAAVCARLGVWQLDRATERGQATARAAAEEADQVPPAALDEVLPPQTGFPGDLVGRRVEVSGEFGTDQLLVPGRASDGVTGMLVLTPLTVEGSGAVLAVVRGWVPDDADVGPAPAGAVTVVGALQAGEAGSDDSQLPPGQVEAISPAELVNRWGGPIYSGYLVLSDVQPAQDDALTPLGAPAFTGAVPALQNLAYALQWWIFGAFAVLLWVRMVRDEARAVAEEQDAAVGGGGVVGGVAGGPAEGGVAPDGAGAPSVPG